MLNDITPLIITHNEVLNIARTLARLTWARRIVVVDSGSTDGTLELLRGYPQVDAIHHCFVDFAMQWNFGLSQVATPWVLSLDADYELSPALLGELRALTPPVAVAGYSAGFVYRVHGRPLRGSLYPPRTVLFRGDRAVYRMDGHAQRVAVDGEVRRLRAVIYHDDRKSLSRWLASQRRYAADEAAHLLAHPWRDLSMPDRLRRLAWPAPIAILFYVLLIKGCLFDGWPGWLYAWQRVLAETLLALEIIDRRLHTPPPC